MNENVFLVASISAIVFIVGMIVYSHEHQYTGQMMVCVMPDGSLHKVP